MKKFLILCFLGALSVTTCLLANSFDEVRPSGPEEFASLNSDLLIDGYVSAFSGQIILSETDLCVKGAQDVVLKRTYIAPPIMGRYDDKDSKDLFFTAQVLSQMHSKGWVIFPHLCVGYNQYSRYIQVQDPRGFVLEFDVKEGKGHFRSSHYGCSNLKGDMPSSAADIRNISLEIDQDVIKVIYPDGLKRIF